MSTRQDGISDLLIHERRKAAIKQLQADLSAAFESKDKHELERLHRKAKLIQAMIDKENEVLKARLAQINSATVELTTARLLCS